MAGWRGLSVVTPKQYGEVRSVVTFVKSLAPDMLRHAEVLIIVMCTMARASHRYSLRLDRLGCGVKRAGAKEDGLPSRQWQKRSVACTWLITLPVL
eukprot:4631139-Amphidinium_carterae.1